MLTSTLLLAAFGAQAALAAPNLAAKWGFYDRRGSNVNGTNGTATNGTSTNGGVNGTTPSNSTNSTTLNANGGRDFLKLRPNADPRSR